jgi:serine/threonine protein kinase
MTDLAPDSVLPGGRYRLERPLGAGGMAVVWLAHDERLDRRVAIKALSDVLAADRGYVRRLEREARIAASLSHPNLVRVFDFSIEGSMPFLVMEYIDGPTLADRLEGTAELEIQPQRLTRELLGAVSHIHAAGIVHRDVKPSNILFGRDGHLRLTDFGIARAEDSTRLTSTGRMIGTLRYIPPEVVAGGPATARSDLYACGVVLRECLAVSPSRSLRKIADQLAADDPELRPRSAADAIAMLERSTAEAASSTAETASLRRAGSADAGAASAPPRPEQTRATPHLGRRPGMADFRRAFVVATAMIAAGIVLIAIQQLR